MIWLTVAFIVLQFIFILYQDITNRREREKLEMKLMSHDLQDYQTAQEKPPKNGESKPDPYVPVEDVPIKKLLDAEDKL